MLVALWLTKWERNGPENEINFSLRGLFLRWLRNTSHLLKEIVDNKL